MDTTTGNRGARPWIGWFIVRGPMVTTSRRRIWNAPAVGATAVHHGGGFWQTLPDLRYYDSLGLLDARQGPGSVELECFGNVVGGAGHGDGTLADNLRLSRAMGMVGPKARHRYLSFCCPMDRFAM